MKETYKPTLLARRRKALAIPSPPSPFPSTGAKIKFLFTVTLLRPLHMLFTEPIVGFLSLYIAFNFGVLFTFFAAFPYIFSSVYGFSTEQSGLVFLAIGVGCVLAIPTVLLSDRFLYLKHYRLSHANGKNGVVAPEHRLYPAMVGSFGLRKFLPIHPTNCLPTSADYSFQQLLDSSGLHGPPALMSHGSLLSWLLSPSRGVIFQSSSLLGCILSTRIRHSTVLQQWLQTDC